MFTYLKRPKLSDCQIHFIYKKLKIKMQNRITQDQGHNEMDISQYFYDQDSKQKENSSKSILNIRNGKHDVSQCLFSQKVSIESNIFRSAKPQTLNMHFQIEQFHLFDDELKVSHSELDEVKEPQKNRKQLSKNKLYAKNYRQKKKQQMKTLQQENRFLKSKIDDLSFRLKQTQLELNKLKHNDSSNTKNFKTTRESILKQIQKVLESSEHTNIQTLLEVKNKMKGLNAFDSKHKMDQLNYFMSELLENLINDFGIYFIDCLIEKKGFWRAYDTKESRRIDMEIAELLGENNFQHLKRSIIQFSELALNHMKNFKLLWKKLYEDYINIINQGLMIETLCRPLEEKSASQNCKHQLLNYFKLELYFEKIKYRKDMRQLRDSWFHDSLSQQEDTRANRLKSICKKVKIDPE